MVTNALTIAGGSTPTGKLDVTNNAVIVDYPAAGPSPATTIRDQIIAGRGGTGLGKTWNGQGITSSQPAADPVNAISVGTRSTADCRSAPLPRSAGRRSMPRPCSCATRALATPTSTAW